ncbi:basic amino acid ABC transporter substrate-binding protein [Snodgrassella alvi]|uniref:basic amino acid ABC transporter substrate-binding protein n=1 Tax=Snodgrassella alvi TaxID=1196083 RepID=UPI002741FDC2|nr:basic amino acid ABC transporter substrate-binding protein [Snodgrassella alvi]WLT01330.1 basic amino acid ABC transporter substrate-binding protein [Snodgrassella alvi]
MKIKHWFAAAAMCSALVLTACSGSKNNSESASAPAQSGADKTYIVGTNAEFAPFESRTANGSLTGFDIDLLTAMAKAGNFKIQFKDQPWDGLFASLNNGDLDIVASGVTITDERKQSMTFSDPYFDISMMVLTPKAKTFHSLAELNNMQRVAVASGQTGDLAVQKILGAQSTKIARFDSVPLAIKELENGGVEAMVSDGAVISNYVKANGADKFTINKVPEFGVDHYGFVVRKGDTATVEKLNDALKKIRASGEYDKIYAKYFSN